MEDGSGQQPYNHLTARLIAKNVLLHSLTLKARIFLAWQSGAGSIVPNLDRLATNPQLCDIQVARHSPPHPCPGAAAFLSPSQNNIATEHAELLVRPQVLPT